MSSWPDWTRTRTTSRSTAPIATHGERRAETRPGRATTGDPQGGAPAPPQVAGVAGLLLGRDLLERVRDPGDDAGPRDRGGRRPRVPGPDRAGDRRPPGDRGDLVPADGLRLSERRRLVHRGPREPRDPARADGGGRTPERLHPHGRRLGRGRHRPGPVG